MNKCCIVSNEISLFNFTCNCIKNLFLRKETKQNIPNINVIDSNIIKKFIFFDIINILIVFCIINGTTIEIKYEIKDIANTIIKSMNDFFITGKKCLNSDFDSLIFLKLSLGFTMRIYPLIKSSKILYSVLYGSLIGS